MDELFNTESEVAYFNIILKKPDLIFNLNSLAYWMFSSRPHQFLFQTFTDLYSRNLLPEIYLVKSFLKDNGQLDLIGGEEYLDYLYNLNYDSKNLNEYERLIVNSYKARTLLHISSEIPNKLTNSANVDDMLSDVRGKLDRLFESAGGETTVPLKDILKSSWNEISTRSQNPGLRGVTTGFESIDLITTGINKGDLWLVGGRPGQGKCLGKGTKVIKFDGTLEVVENLEVGDLLMGPDSKPRKILSTTSGKEMMYWIRQNKAIDYRVNESHILSLKRSKTENKQLGGTIRNISVHDILKSQKYIESRYKGYKSPVEFSEKKINISPYYLGLWLGDGKSSDLRIYNKDLEVVDFISSYAEECGLSVTIGDLDRNCQYYNIRGNSQNKNWLRNEFKGLGLFNNKHIPDNYLYTNSSSRLELLAGLIDSDGYVFKNYVGFEITQKSQILSNQIKYLCDSLGFRTRLTKKIAKSQFGTESEVYRLQVYGDLSIIPTKVARKFGRGWKSGVDWRVTGFHIEKDKIDSYYGFELDGDGLFLLEDFTVTHNTALMCNMALNGAKAGVKSLIFELEMNKQALVERFLAIDTGIYLTPNIRMGYLSNKELQMISDSIESFKELPILVDTNFVSSIDYLESTIRKYKKLRDIDVVYLDYIQLLVERDSNATAELGRVSRRLKLLANDLGIGVVILSQLNRKVEERDDKRPLMSDLRQSGNLEEDSDLMIGLFRDSYYNPESKNKTSLEFIIRKHRNGPIGNIELGFRAENNAMWST